MHQSEDVPGGERLLAQGDARGATNLPPNCVPPPADQWSSLCYTVGPCWLSILYIVVNPKLQIYPSPTPTFPLWDCYLTILVINVDFFFQRRLRHVPQSQELEVVDPGLCGYKASIFPARAAPWPCRPGLSRQWPLLPMFLPPTLNSTPTRLLERISSGTSPGPGTEYKCSVSD